MDINERQNSELNLKRLSSQRQLYSDAKKIMHIQFIMGIMVVILLGIVGNIISDEYAVYPTFLSITCALLDEFFLTKRIKDLQFGAASIQENFDCDVLQIPFNHIKNCNRTTLETIQENNRKYLLKYKNYDSLIDWYPGMEDVDSKYGRIICQSTNCWWDQKLREKYSNVLIHSTVVVFIILVLIGLARGITLSRFIMSVISPILPIGVLVYKIVRDNKKAIENSDNMRRKLDEIIDDMKKKELYSDEKLMNDSRCLQDIIFENRASSPLIPDKFYRIYREKYEEIAQNSNQDLLKLMK